MPSTMQRRSASSASHFGCPRVPTPARARFVLRARAVQVVVILLAAVAVVALLRPRAAAAQTVKPRFVLLVDTSGSMAQDAAQTFTHGDGSREHPGCDLDGNGRFDDSKMFQAKAALNDTLAAFGSVEFALARYRQTELGQTCGSNGQCTAMGFGGNACVGGRCGFIVGSNSPDYDECRVGRGCTRCADPDADPRHVFYNGVSCCLAGEPTAGGFGLAGDVLVPFPAGASNLPQLTSWIDNREDFPAGSNRELRASGTTPIGGSLNAVRDWLVNDASTVGPGGGVLNRDDKGACRSYNVILITDGLEVDQCVTNCRIRATSAADLLYHSCTNNGVYDRADGRCEIGGEPFGTREVRVRTYVVGFNVNDPQLNALAAAGGTGSALVANNQAELTARLGDILAGSIPSERCDCQDNTCDGEVDETFRAKGDACTVGVGRCKRQGRLGCNADGSGLTCSAAAVGVCPAAPLTAGQPLAETCGASAGCEAPTAEDCADDDCDGLIDENMSCACAAKPEVCNGLDDDCNGRVDDVAQVRCGLEIGECRPGLTSCEGDGAGGKRTVCSGATQPSAELCDNRDNDCDGLVDSFGLACFPAGAAGCSLAGAPLACAGAPRERWTCQGVCRTGVTTCTAGQCGSCEGAVAASPELACDGVDNDCDGQVDEGFGVGDPCGPGLSGAGPCRPGVQMCVAGQLRCVGGVGPGEEVCNQVDDDCDGTVDNLPGACGPIRGECRPGRWSCAGPVMVCEQPQGPRPEFCDGLDNDCDGQVDEDPFDPELQVATACGRAVGICQPGILRCLGGAKLCDGGVEPRAESCNALDDDCDGTTDEGINPPGPCPAPGLTLGTPILGECRPGSNVCRSDGGGGARFVCEGGVGPRPEICDGKDDDCDGAVDDGAACPAGQGCADGECVPECAGGGVCPSDRLCQAGLCRYAECVRTPCQAGFRCESGRGCVDRCEGVTCPGGTRCENGECTSCLVRGCPAGQVCRGDRCQANPCAGLTCPAGGYCRDGACVAGCVGVRCQDGEVCQDGRCLRDRCAGVSCPGGQRCDSSVGGCVADACAGISCLPGQTCLPGQATCADDPCMVTTCPAGQACRARADGLAECRVAREVAAAGGGCACALGGVGSSGSDGSDAGGGTALGLALALGLTLLRRRRGGARP